jgi:hypothetical protein
MHAAIAEEIYRHPDEASSRTPDSPSGRSLVYSISTKGSQQSDEETSQASQIHTIDLDMNKVEEFGQVIAFLETEEIEKTTQSIEYSLGNSARRMGNRATCCERNH